VRPQAVTLPKNPKQEMLCADVAVVRPFGFFLRECQDLLRPLGEPFEGIDGEFPSQM